MDEDIQLVTAAQKGDLKSFETLIIKYQPRIFATVRRYAKNENNVEDVVQEIFIKAHQKLHTYAARAPFEHWLMRLAVRTCYDFLRVHQRNRETTITDLSQDESDWLDRFMVNPDLADDQSAAARELVGKAMAALSPKARLVINLMEIEGYSVREIAQTTGWSVPLVKVRAFRARREMRKILDKIIAERQL